MNGLALCAGGGGLELGLSLALGDAYRTVCVVEREVYAAAVLVSRMEEGRLHPAPVWDDLTTFNGRRWRGCVDILSAGFPCQPFSAAGKRQSDDDSRHLWPHVRRVINGARPALVFLENVGALISTRQRDGRPAYMVVRNELERLGYRVTETLVRASDVGAPHQRERVFILGHAKQFRRASPAPSTGAGLGYTPGVDGEAPNSSHRQGPGENRRTSGCMAGTKTVAGAQSVNRSLQLSQRGQDQTVSESRRTGRDFPPGPGDRHAWAAILAERPELAPAVEPLIRGVANGVAGALEHRTQRLRLLGNGVVPLAAAVAFRTCADTLGLAIEELRHTHTEGMDESTKPADS